MTLRAVFLDVDGVLLDPARTSAEWGRLMGDVLAPGVGGSPADWGRANSALVPELFRNRERWRDDDPLVSERSFGVLWLTEMCRFLGHAPPVSDAAWQLSLAVSAYVCRHADCAFPATIDVIRELALSYDVHLATGNPSWRMEPLLEQWGVRDLIGVPAGTDLVRVMKDSLQFHPAVLALAGVAPERAVVVDDDPEQVRRARALGARGVWVAAGAEDRSGAGCDVADAVISNIAELPDALRGIG